MIESSRDTDQPRRRFIAWAEHVLQSKLRVESLPADAGARTYLRLRGPAGTLIGVMTPCPETEYLFGPSPALSRNDDAFQASTLFLSQRRLAVARLIARHAEEPWLLIEDLGDRHLAMAVTSLDPAQTTAIYLRVVEWILGLQASTRDPGAELPRVCQRRFDSRTLRWELDHFTHEYAEATGRLGSATRRHLQAAFDATATELGAPTPAPTHRDLHARNIMVVGDDPVPIDHQDLCLGPPFYDLASLVWDSYSLGSLPSSTREQCIRVFGSRTGQSLRHIEQLVALQAVQRALKVIGRFAWLASIRGQRHRLEDVQALFDLIATIADDVPAVADLAALLLPLSPRLSAR